MDEYGPALRVLLAAVVDGRLQVEQLRWVVGEGVLLRPVQKSDVANVERLAAGRRHVQLLRQVGVERVGFIAAVIPHTVDVIVV